METSGPFALADSIENHRRQAAERTDLIARAAAVAALARGGRVVSYGVGAALLERHLLDAGVPLTITENAPLTVERLGQLLPEAEVVEHDLAVEPPVPGGLHLLHRVETELDNRTWRRVFSRFADQRVLVSPGGVIAWREMPWTLVHVWRTRHATRAGWLRTRAALEALWQESHRGTRTDLAGSPAWMLEPRL
jgi:hypothetical protein